MLDFTLGYGLANRRITALPTFHNELLLVSKLNYPRILLLAIRVPKRGVEPLRPKTLTFEISMSTNSITTA